MATPWYAYPITQAHGQNNEEGIDIGTPWNGQGVPVTALFGGTVRFAGRTQWACGSSGGEVTVVCALPSGLPVPAGLYTSYYLHLDQVQVKAGDTVEPGDVLGTSGGQLIGGTMPVINCPPNAIYSTGAHVEFGFNASWVSGPGHNVDPTWAITMARNGSLPHVSSNGSATAGGTTAGGTPASIGSGQPAQPTYDQALLLAFYGTAHTANRVITQPTGWDGLCMSLEYNQEVPEWNWMNPIGSFGRWLLAFGWRWIFMSIAALVVLSVIWQWVKGPVLAVGSQAAASATEAGLSSAGAPEAGMAVQAARNRFMQSQQTTSDTALPPGVTTAPDTVAR